MIEIEELENYKRKIYYRENGTIVAIVLIEETPDIINIIDVLVDENFRRRGIGEKLIRYILNLYKNNQVKFMLEVRDDNHAAICLYDKCGFKEIYRRKKYYKERDAIIMEYEKKDVYILAIESSCDDTSVSIVKNGCEDIATSINTQIDTHMLYGGVIPEVASRLHLENITLVIDETLKKANMSVKDMDAIAVTYSPGLLGSLLVGVESAKALSMVYNKPLIKVNHMLGHICANNINKELKYPLISLIISGGHTDLIYMESEKNFKYVGRTLDDAVGECYDKVARILDMPYPGGPNIERLASKGMDTYKMPELLNDDSCNFSFSGIKSHINNLVNNKRQKGENINKNDLACSFQNAITKSLVNKAKKALNEYGAKYLSVAGGVASNSYIRENLKKMCEENGVEMFIPDKKYCTDNATMIGAAAYIYYKNKDFASLDLNASSHEELDEVNL